MTGESRTMRDAFIEKIYTSMEKDKSIFFLCADFGAPKLDELRTRFKDRFINVGIAEQNLINVATGLALEGFTVYAYAIAPFLTMRAYEQIRVNLSLHSQLKDINVNLIGVGAGLSYDVSGPTHHSLEDISIMMTLPNIHVLSPCDWKVAEAMFDYTLMVRKPKYLRFDSKPAAPLYVGTGDNFSITKGFHELYTGKDLCVVSTGIMTHKAVQAAARLKKAGNDIGVIDVFMMKPLDGELFCRALSKYRAVVTLEEGFINSGGLDDLVLRLIRRVKHRVKFKNIGFAKKYVFNIGSRDYLHRLNGLDVDNIGKNVISMLNSVQATGRSRG